MAEIYRSDIVRVDLDHALLRKHVGAILVTGDKLGNRFGAEIFRDGKPVDATGCGVTAYFMRPGEDAIVLNGTASGSVAYVDLAQACYSKASSFTLTIKISYGGATTALRVIDGYILLTQTDDLVDPGDVVPTLDDIFAQIATMEAATERAQAATADAIAAKDNANGAAVNAVNIATEKGDQAIQLAQEEADKQNEKIATLTEDIGELYSVDTVVAFSEADFERGVFYDGVNASWDDDTKIRNKNIVSYPYSIIVAPTKRSFMVALYDDKGAFVSQSAWEFGLYVIPANTPFRLCIMEADTGSTLPTIGEYLDGFNCYKKELAEICDKNYLLENLLNASNVKLNKLFEQGATGDKAVNSTWLESRTIRTKRIISMPCECKMSATNGTVFAIAYFEDDAFVSNTDWVAEYVIPPNKPFRAIIRAVNDGGVDDILSDVTIVNRAFVIGAQKANSFPLTTTRRFQSREGRVNATIPPNSKWAVQAAANNQYDRIRFTVNKSTDGVYICCHDDYIKYDARNPDGSEITEDIRVDSLSLAQLNSYDWGIKFGEKYKGMNIPTLADALYYAALYNIGVSVEFNFALSQTDVDAIYTMMCDYAVVENFIAISYNIGFAEMFAEKDKRIGILWGGTEEELKSMVASLSEIKKNGNPVYVWHAPFGSDITEAFGRFAQANGFGVFVTIFSPDEFPRCFRSGVSVIECANIEDVKSTFRDYADAVVGDE